MTFDDEIKRLRAAGITYLQVEIGDDGAPRDVILGGRLCSGRGSTLDDAVRDIREKERDEVERIIAARRLR